MSMEDVILVATVREEIRGGTLRVDAADIPRHIEVVQAGKVIRPVGKDVHWDRPESRSTGPESDSTIAPAADPNVGAGIAKTMRVATASGPQHRGTKECYADESDVKRSVSVI